MKTIIEMAREAGFNCLLPDEAMDMIGGVFEDDNNITKALERFAALVREDEREKQQGADGTADQQQPVAWLELHNGKPNDLAFESFDLEHDLPEWEVVPLYTAPPTAALAEEWCKGSEDGYERGRVFGAIQMRDAAVNTCQDVLKGETNDSDYTLGFETAAANLAVWIAALPVPEAQWVELTDDEIDELQNREFSQNDWLRFYTCAVIAKFKEKQL